MIEFAPVFFSRLTYDEAWLYCLILEHNGHKDWRMLTHGEWRNRNDCFGWYENAAPRIATSARAVCPVRDI